ncbi:uncharacterized protein LOC117649200 [Thrips palmi]|uniref:Uncharacterized protein LOC117649200 n=1 Tax=Thrips palmi TaxID=161013 RepID=A0A6P8ZRH4_THRPL|nr:uncharacterized protein LOC117649200 [Thrips palmi]
MGRPVKVLLLLAVVYGSVLLVASLGYQQDWKRIAAYNIVMREVCHECDVLCPRAPYPTSDEERADISQQWACYIGCRTTCLLQIGPEKYSYETAVDLCSRGCHDEYRNRPDPNRDNNPYLNVCLEACSAKVSSTGGGLDPLDSIVSKALSDPASPDLPDEQETGPFDPALGEPYAQNGVLPRSNYKTIPHNNAPYHVAGNGKTPVEYFVKFIRYPTTDPLLAGVVGIPLFVLVIGFAAYYVVLLRRPPNFKNDDAAENLDEEVPVTVLRVHLEAELKKVPSSSEFSDEEFVPPPSPPPKYSDVVHNV